MIIHFENNNRDLEWWEVQKGIVTGCNNRDIWGHFWLGCKVLTDPIYEGSQLTFIDKIGEVRTMHFKVVKLEYAEAV